MNPVTKAFKAVPREYFLPSDQADNVGIDAPLPIGFGQTNSQPSTVQMMLEWLEVEPGNKILDVGSGSGWTTALLAYLTGPKGRVYAVETVAQLLEFGRSNNEHLGVRNAEFHKASEKYGLVQFAPYDRILVSASASELPQVLIDQLKHGGKMVIPVKNDILEIEKLSNGQLETFLHSGFIFVPLIRPYWTGAQTNSVPEATPHGEQ